MKKIIASALILSMLSTSGVVCFAKNESYSVALAEVVDTIEVPVSEKENIKQDLETLKNIETLTPQRKETLANRIKVFFKEHWKIFVGAIGTLASAAVIILLIFLKKHNIGENKKNPDEKTNENDFKETIEHINKQLGLDTIDQCRENFKVKCEVFKNKVEKCKSELSKSELDFESIQTAVTELKEALIMAIDALKPYHTGALYIEYTWIRNAMSLVEQVLIDINSLKEISKSQNITGIIMLLNATEVICDSALQNV